MRGSFWSSDRALVSVLTLATIVPAVIAWAILASGDTWFPGGDMAQAELHMRGFFSHPPLVGAAGRIVSDSGFQGSHPGPSLWVAMLPVYLLGGRTSSSLMAAVVSVHLVASAGIVWLAFRRGGAALAWGSALAVLVIVRSAGPDFLIEPWNPWLAILPFGVFVLLIAELVDPTTVVWEERRALVMAAAVLVGSHCIQCHAGYALVVVASVVGAFVAVVVGAKGTRRWRTGWPLLLSSTVAGFVIWLPPILDQFRREPGNLDILWQHFGSPSEPTVTIGRAAREIATQVNLLGPWLTGPGSGSPSRTWAKYVGCLAFLALWSWSWFRARQRGWRRERILLTVGGATILVGAISITRIFGPFYEYTFRWMWVLAALSVVSALSVVGKSIRGPGRGMTTTRRRWVATGVLVGLMSITSWQIATAVKLPGATDSRITGDLQRQLVDELDRNDRYLIRFYDPYTLNATGFGLTLALERVGFDVGVEPAFAAAALPHRTRTVEQVDEILWVVVGPAIDRARQDPALTEMAYYNPRTAEQQARAERLLVEIADGLRGTGRADLVSSLRSPGASLIFVEPPLEPEVAELVRQLIGMGQPVGVFMVPPGVDTTSVG